MMGAIMDDVGWADDDLLEDWSSDGWNDESIFILVESDRGTDCLVEI